MSNRKGRRKSPSLKALQKQWRSTEPSPIAPKPSGSAKNNANQKE